MSLLMVLIEATTQRGKWERHIVATVWRDLAANSLSTVIRNATLISQKTTSNPPQLLHLLRNTLLLASY